MSYQLYDYQYSYTKFPLCLSSTLTQHFQFRLLKFPLRTPKFPLFSKFSPNHVATFVDLGSCELPTYSNHQLLPMHVRLQCELRTKLPNKRVQLLVWNKLK